jgi:hypothetical protein
MPLLLLLPQLLLPPLFAGDSTMTKWLADATLYDNV